MLVAGDETHRLARTREGADAEARRRRLALTVAGLAIPMNGGVVAALAVFLAALRERVAWQRTPLDLPLALLLTWSVIAAAVNRPHLPAILQIGVSIVAIYLAFQLPYRWLRAGPGLPSLVALWACVATAAAAAIGLITYLRLPTVHPGWFRRFSLGDEPPGVFAFALEVGMLVGLGAVQRYRWLSVAAVACGTFALLGTLTRWAVLGFAVGLGIWTGATARRHPRAAVLTVAAAAIATIIMLSLPLWDALIAQYVRADSTQDAGSTAGWRDTLSTAFSPQLGLADRLVVWRATLRMVGDHPVFGIGYGAFGRTYPRYLDPGDATITVLETPGHLWAQHPHNEALAVAAGAGIPAAAAYLALIAVALWKALSRPHPASVPFAAALIAMTVHGMFDAVSTTFAGPHVVFWLVLAGTVHAVRRSDGAGDGT